MLIHAPEALEWVEVERVVDADTLHVRRRGRLEKLRLSCVDAEEKLSSGADVDPLKPETVFGEETALWARELFAGLAGADGRMRAGLSFPAGREERDRYGRLLANVALSDGRDFNLLLVRLGRSPYFNKYGNSLELHAPFERAQELAQREGLGIWNHATNTPAAPRAPSARREYTRLCAWWGARAIAVDAFRAARAADPLGVVAADDLAGLERARADGRKVAVFGAPEAILEREDGSLDLLFPSPERDRELWVRIHTAHRAALAGRRLSGLTEPWRQNYVWVEGRLLGRSHGWLLVLEGARRLRPAGPEPARTSR